MQNQSAISTLNFENYFQPRVVKMAMNVGPCHHGMARPRVADGGTASNMEGSCE